MLIGGIEAGGTKIVCGAAEVTQDRMRFATGRPEEAVRKAADYFKDFPIKALGVACFGPLDLRKDSATYGHIMATPKKGWEHFDLLGPLEKEIGVPAVLDTDVNGAALGEGAYGAGKGKSVVAYITVGTGIGVGLSIGGKPLHGLVHPEGGHMPVVRAPGDTYEGRCTFHRDSCLPDASKGMPQGLPSKNDGARRGKTWEAAAKSGRWKRSISRRAYHRSRFSARRISSSWEAASCTRHPSSRWSGKE